MARTTAVLITVLLLATLSLVPVWSAAEAPAEAAAPADPAPAPAVMPISEVRTGMTGYGLTAFKGARPVRFDVEVLGVLTGWFPKGAIILVRMKGPEVEEAGIISGMSGSPVYIDERLIGAVAYGWPNTTSPLAGITPAADMLAVTDIDTRMAAPGEGRVEAKARAREALLARSRGLTRLLTAPNRTTADLPALRAAAARLALPVRAPQPFTGWGRDAMPASVSAMLPAGADARLRPLPLPVAISGSHAAGSAMVPLLDAGGFLPVQAMAAATGDGPFPEVAIEPGIPVGTPLISGDLDIAGTGTLTWVGGNRILAFGHPMFGSGDTDLPLAVAHVQAVVPSRVNSFKISVTGKTIGRIVQDREPAIMGVLGEEAPTFPCRVKVTGVVDEEYDYRVAGHWEVASQFAMMAAAASSARWEGESNRYAMTASSRIKLVGRDEPLVLANVYNSYTTAAPGTDLVARPIQALMTNPFLEVEVESIDFDIDVRTGFEVAAIESAWADKTEVEPGGELTVHVRLVPYRGAPARRTLTLAVPETARPGSQVQVLISDAVSNRMIEMSLDPGFYSPLSFEALYARIEHMTPNTQMVMRASVFERGLRYDGDAMPTLPPSAMTVLQHNRMGGQAAPLITDVVQGFETPWVLEGSQSVTFTVKDREPFRP